MKFLIIGLDGADPYLVEEADMSNLKSIGKIQRIKTYSNSGPAWASLVTGVQPQKHGVGLLTETTKLSDLKAPPIWEKVKGMFGVANLPIADRPARINGWFVAGILCPSVARCTYPASLSKKLLKLGYEIALEGGPWVEQDPEVGNEFLQREWKRILPKRTRVFKYLLERHPVDSALLIYTCLDSIQHRLMHDKEKVFKWYLRVDKEIGKLLDLEHENTILVSDHGFERAGPISRYRSLITGLRFRGLRKTIKELDLTRIPSILTGRDKKHRVITGEHRPVSLFVSDMGFTPQRIEEVLTPLVKSLGAP